MAETDPDEMGEVKMVHLNRCFVCKQPALHLIWESEEREDDVCFWMACTGGKNCGGGLYEIALDKDHRLTETFRKFPALDTNN